MKSGEIRVAAIHDVESAGFQWDQIQSVDLVEFPVGDVDKTWDAAPKVQQCVKPDRSL